MSEPTAPGSAAAEPSVFEDLRHIREQAGDYARARLELAKAEAREAGSTAVWALAFAAAAGVVAALAYALLIGALVALAAVLCGGGLAWAASFGVAALLHGVGVWVLLLLAKRRWKSGFFTLSREQFAQEKEWLQRTRAS